MFKRLTVVPFLIVLFFAVSTMFSSPAYAHFLIEDPKTGEESYFHSTPEHRPIAGKASTISYDFRQSDRDTKAYDYTLTAKRAKGKEIIVSTEIISNVVITDYVFPVQGLYELKLTASPKVEGTGKTSIFVYNQRVARGTEEKKKRLWQFRDRDFSNRNWFRGHSVGVYLQRRYHKK